MDTVGINQKLVDECMLHNAPMTREEFKQNGVREIHLRDAYAFFDAICPPWSEQATTITEAGAYVTPDTLSARERTALLPASVFVVDGLEFYLPQRRFVMPYQRYIRAMNAAGFVQPLSVSTFRHGIEKDQLEEQVKYQAYVELAKPHRGWLFCERGAWQKVATHIPREAHGEDPYGRFLLSQYVKRTLDQRHKMTLEDERHRSQQEKLARESLETQHSAQETLAQQNAALQEMLRQNAETQAALLETIKTLTAGKSRERSAPVNG